MKKLKYILILFAVSFYSCEQSYDLEIDMSNTADAYLIIRNSDVTVSETKAFDLELRTYIPYWEDVTINWTISGDNFDSFSGTGTFPACTGESGTYQNNVNVTIPSSVIPDGLLFVEGTLSFTCTTSSGKVIVAGQNGENADLFVTINKYIPLDRSKFVGTYTENDGTDDYTGVVVEEDPDDEFGLIINTKTWGDGGAYKVVFNTVAENVNLVSQFIGIDYFDGVSTDGSAQGAVWFAPAASGKLGSFDLTTGNFIVELSHSIPNYPYAFGDMTLTYTK